MHYNFNPITMSITIANTSITCIAASIPSPSPCQSTSPSRLSHPLQPLSYNNIHHFHNHRHHVYPMHYSLYLLTMSNTSITIAITSNTWITASIVKQCLSHRHHVYHMHYSLSPITMCFTSISIAITCIISIKT